MGTRGENRIEALEMKQTRMSWHHSRAQRKRKNPNISDFELYGDEEEKYHVRQKVDKVKARIKIIEERLAARVENTPDFEIYLLDQEIKEIRNQTKTQKSKIERQYN